MSRCQKYAPRYGNTKGEWKERFDICIDFCPKSFEFRKPFLINYYSTYYVGFGSQYVADVRRCLSRTSLYYTIFIFYLNLKGALFLFPISLFKSSSFVSLVSISEQHELRRNIAFRSFDHNSYLLQFSWLASVSGSSSDKLLKSIASKLVHTVG